MALLAATSVLLGGCSLFGSGGDEPAPLEGKVTTGAELGLPQALDTVEQDDTTALLVPERAVALELSPAEQVKKDATRYVAGGRVASDPKSGGVVLPSRKDAAGVTEALDDEGNLVAAAVFMNTTNTIPGISDMIDVIKDTAAAEALALPDTIAACEAMDLVGVAMSFGATLATCRENLGDKQRKEIEDKIQQSLDIAKDATDLYGGGTITLRADDIPRGFTVVTYNRADGGATSKAFPNSDPMDREIREWRAAVGAASIFSQVIKPLWLLMSNMDKEAFADEPKKDSTNQQVLWDALKRGGAAANASGKWTDLQNEFTEGNFARSTVAVGQLALFILDSPAMRTALVQIAISEGVGDISVRALKRQLMSGTKGVKANQYVLFGDSLASVGNLYAGGYNIRDLAKEYAADGDYAVIVPKPAPPKPVSQNVQPTCDQILAIVKKWSKADRNHFMEQTDNGQYGMYIGHPFTEEKSFHAVYTSLLSETGDAYQERYVVGKGWELVTGGGIAEDSRTADNYRAVLAGHPVTCTKK